MFLGQAGMFLSFQPGRSSATRSSTSDLTVGVKVRGESAFNEFQRVVGEVRCFVYTVNVLQSILSWKLKKSLIRKADEYIVETNNSWCECEQIVYESMLAIWSIAEERQWKDNRQVLVIKCCRCLLLKCALLTSFVGCASGYVKWSLNIPQKREEKRRIWSRWCVLFASRHFFVIMPLLSFTSRISICPIVLSYLALSPLLKSHRLFSLSDPDRARVR